MSKLCFIDFGNSKSINSVASYFAHNNKVTVLTDDRENFINSEQIEFCQLDLNLLYDFFLNNKFDLYITENFIDDFGRQDVPSSKVINLHYSLLPSFPVKDAARKSFLYGIKVGGITFHTIEKSQGSDRIILQYPSIVHNLMHYDEYEKSLINLGNMFYPKVAEMFLKNSAFDMSELFSASHKCGSCGSCSGQCS